MYGTKIRLDSLTVRDQLSHRLNPRFDFIVSDLFSVPAVSKCHEPRGCELLKVGRKQFLSTSHDMLHLADVAEI